MKNIKGYSERKRELEALGLTQDIIENILEVEAPLRHKKRVEYILSLLERLKQKLS